MINFIKNNNKISNTYTNEIFEIYKLQYINLLIKLSRLVIQ